MSNQEKLAGYTCVAVGFLGIGIVVVGYAIHMSNLAARGGIGQWIYAQSATAMYMFGVPTLIIGIASAINAYLQFSARRQPETETRRPSLAPGSRRISSTIDPEKIDIVEIFCPDCGKKLGSELSMKRPDGSVVCGKCYKRFIP